MSSGNGSHCPICSRNGEHHTEGGDFHFYRCPSCSVLYSPRSAALEAEAKADPTALPWAKAYVPESQLNRVLSLLKQFDGTPSEIRSLDFGTANADLPRFLRGYGYNAMAIDAPYEKLSYPWWYYRGNIFDADYPSGFFHLITAIGSFDAIPDPVPIVRELTRILRPGGVIYVHTESGSGFEPGRGPAPFAQAHYKLREEQRGEDEVVIRKDG